MTSRPPLMEEKMLAGAHRTLFESWWKLLDSKKTGRIDGGTAAQFLKKSQLRETVLHKIWNLCDSNGTGFLDKQSFFLAMRLVAVCQNGKEPATSNLSINDPAPHLVGVELPPTTVNLWTIDEQERAKFYQAFQSQQLVNGLLSGEKAKPLMLATKLPVNTLGKIWNLSDIDCDGHLDKDEFAVAMKLLALAQAGEILPATLPSSLIPPAKVKPIQPSLASTALSTTTSFLAESGATTSSPRHSASPAPSPILAKKQPGAPVTTPPTTGTTTSDWVVTSEVKAKYDAYFHGIDKDGDGYVTGEEAKGLLSASNLPLSQLAHIWNLCDLSKTGKLNAEQFSLAMFLVADKVRGNPLPTELTPAMIPPSLRKSHPLPSSSVAATPTSILVSNLDTSSMSTTFTMTTTSVTSTTGAWGIPSNGTIKSADSSELGFGSDFSAIKELDSVANEIEDMKKEKAQLTEDIKVKQELVQLRKGELTSLKSDVDSATSQCMELEKEKAEAQGKLDQLDNEKAQIERQIAELKQKCQDEQTEIERLKAQYLQQESSKLAQTEELEKLKEQLEKVKKEEREYKAKVDAGKIELERLSKANMSIQAELSQTKQKVEMLKEEHSTLTNQLTLFPPVSSNVINIMDVGQLSSELHVPNLSEPDAVSARATAGSSSPVSSISGFSTNSHLEEPSDDTTVHGGGGVSALFGGKDDSKKTDPFSSSTSSVGGGGSGSDLFAAFTLPAASTSSDPFFSGVATGSSLKPSSVSAFDPFGLADPFKSSGNSRAGTATESTGGGMFESDPFGSTSIASSASRGPNLHTAGPTSGAPPIVADPFSGEDPFSLDPFSASTTTTSANKGGVDQASPWGSSSPFDVDPFSNQQNVLTPTDPFGSGGSDPFGFGSEPFGSAKSDSTGVSLQSNNNNKSSIKQEIVIPESLPKPGPKATNREHIAWAKRESEREEAIRRKQAQEEAEDLEKAIRDSMQT